MPIKRLYRLVLGITLTALLITGHTFAQSGTGQVQILQLNTDAFPIISLSFRAINADGSIVEGLSSSTLVLRENGFPVADLSLSTGQDTPQILAFVIDTGFALVEMNDEIVDLLNAAASSLRDGIDTVVVLEHNDSQPGRLLFGPDTNTLHFREWIPTYQRERTISNRVPLQSLEAAIGQIEQLNVSGRSASTIIYIGQLIEAPVQANFGSTLTQIHQRAARLGTSIYSFNLGSGDSVNTQRVNEVASAPNRVFSLSDGQDPSLLLQDFYAQLSRQRLTYHVQYRVPAVDANTDRYLITLQINQAVADENYTVSIDPPLVTIVAPLPGTTITRAAQVIPDGDNDATNDRWAFGVSSVPVQASVSFSDGVERSITSAQLLVDGVPTLVLSGNTVLDYVWDISNLVERGSHPRTLQVSVTDAFGLISSSPSQTLNVLVDIPDDVVTPEITVEETIVVQTTCEKDINSTDCLRERITVIAPWAGVGALLLLVINQRRRIGKGAVAAGAQAVRIASFVRDSVIKTRSEPYAEFRVLEGALHVGRILPMHGQQITFGRDPMQTNVQLYPLERLANERSEQCSISSKHCTVEYDLSNKRFTVTDHSRYGTFIKRAGSNEPERLEKEVASPLRDNDELLLGVISANGARLQFMVNSNLSITMSGRGRIPTNVNESSSANGRASTVVEPAKPGRIPTDVNDGSTTKASIVITGEVRTPGEVINTHPEQEGVEKTGIESSQPGKYTRTERAKKLDKL